MVSAGIPNSRNVLFLQIVLKRAAKRSAGNPVEPDLALHQSFLKPSPGPSPESCWTWPGAAPSLPDLPEPSSEPCWTSPEPCWTWPGSTPKPPRPSPEPSPKPCWTWPGSAPKPPRPSPVSLRYWGKNTIFPGPRESPLRVWFVTSRTSRSSLVLSTLGATKLVEPGGFNQWIQGWSCVLLQ